MRYNYPFDGAYYTVRGEPTVAQCDSTHQRGNEPVRMPDQQVWDGWLTESVDQVTEIGFSDTTLLRVHHSPTLANGPQAAIVWEDSLSSEWSLNISDPVSRTLWQSGIRNPGGDFNAEHIRQVAVHRAGRAERSGPHIEVSVMLVELRFYRRLYRPYGLHYRREFDHRLGIEVLPFIRR